MKNRFIEYPKCTTCQKAKKWLQANQIPFEEQNIVEHTPTKEELRDYIAKSGKEVNKWFNTSGLKYKELHLKDRLPTMTDEEKLTLLASEGMLIKRPIFISSSRVFIGFKEEEWKVLK